MQSRGVPACRISFVDPRRVAIVTLLGYLDLWMLEVASSDARFIRSQLVAPWVQRRFDPRVRTHMRVRIIRAMQPRAGACRLADNVLFIASPT